MSSLYSFKRSNKADPTKNSEQEMTVKEHTVQIDGELL